MGIFDRQLYDANAKEKTIVGSRKKNSPEVVGQLQLLMDDIEKQTNYAFGTPELFEQYWYEWLVTKKDYTFTEIQNVSKKKDDEVLGLFSEFHKDIIEHKNRVPEYLEAVGEYAMKKVVNPEKTLLGSEEAKQSLKDFKDKLGVHLQGLNTKHRYWFTGKDSMELSVLKQSVRKLSQTGPSNERDETFKKRYIKGLYETLNKALKYKVAKDEDGKDVGKRTNMGRERYKANDALINTLITEIKRVEPAIRPHYTENGIADKYPKIKLEANNLLGKKLLSDKADTESMTKEMFLRDTFNANILNTKKKLDTVEDLEVVLKTDKLFRKYANADLNKETTYIKWAKDPQPSNVPLADKKQGAVAAEKVADANVIFNKADDPQPSNLPLDDKKQENLAVENVADTKVVFNKADEKKTKETLEELNTIINIIENRKKQEEKEREFVPAKKSKEQMKIDRQKQKEFDEYVHANKKIVSKTEFKNTINTKISNYLLANGKTKKDLGKEEYRNLYNRFVDEIVQKKKIQSKPYENAEEKLQLAKMQARQNEARNLQKKLNSNPMSVLLDEIEKEIKVRNSNLNDKKGIENSTYKSLFYQVILDEYCHNIGMDPAKKNKSGFYKIADIAERQKELGPEGRKKADTELKSALMFGVEENVKNMKIIRESKFGEKLSQRLNQLLDSDDPKINKGKSLNHAGIVKLRDIALNDAMDEYAKGGSKDAKNLENMEKLSRAFGSKVTKDNKDIKKDYSKNKSFEIKKNNFAGINL